MTLAPTLHVDDLTPEEGAAVLGAYDAALAAGTDHEEAFAAAMAAHRALRPALPPALAAIEVEMLLALAPA